MWLQPHDIEAARLAQPYQRLPLSGARRLKAAAAVGCTLSHTEGTSSRHVCVALLCGASPFPTLVEADSVPFAVMRVVQSAECSSPWESCKREDGVRESGGGPPPGQYLVNSSQQGVR